jgi:small subunit ribosomal protein S18
MPPSSKKQAPRTICILCRENIEQATLRDTEVLRRYISSQNKILPRRKTGSCAKHQRRLAREIKRAREMGLLGYRGQ